MSDNVGSITISSGVIKNVGLAVGISVISHSVLEKLCTSGLESAILKYGGQLTSRTVDVLPFDIAQCQRSHHCLGRVQKYEVAVRISVIPHTVTEKLCTSGLESAILNSVSLRHPYGYRRREYFSLIKFIRNMHE